MERNPYRTLGELQRESGNIDLARMIRTARNGYLPSVERIETLAAALMDTRPLELLLTFAVDAGIEPQDDSVERHRVAALIQALPVGKRRVIYRAAETLALELREAHRPER